EMTGELDENQLRAIEQRLQYLRNLHTRKEEVIRLIEEQGKLTEELQKQIVTATKLQEVEDYYRPYRQKRRTRASVAKERGLEPLAEWIWSQPTSGDVESEASRYIDEEKDVTSTEQAIGGALDIVAEQIAEDPAYRQWIREQTFKRGVIRSIAKNKEELGVYEMYADYSEPVHKCPAHRVLAMNRGEREEVLRISIDGVEEKVIEYLHKKVITNSKSVVVDLLVTMMEDSYKRLISPSVEREIRNQLTEMAEEQAIHIFSENLRPLLLQPPVQGKVILGVDPAYRTGCKLAVIDENGKVLEIAVVYPTPPVKKVEEAKRTVHSFIDRHNVEIIAIGNGTASRETEQFVTDVIKESTRKLSYIIVNEAGASVYSASKLAGEEFPELDVAERSAISIARRLQDPLAELVKIEP
ncbi:MAG: Tex-like N-terminal domain-containing protein, partial [Bacilli bacterium]